MKGRATERIYLSILTTCCELLGIVSNGGLTICNIVQHEYLCAQDEWNKNLTQYNWQVHHPNIEREENT